MSRDVAELTYSRDLVNGLADDPLIGEFVGDKLTYIPTTTREHSDNMGRITNKLSDGSLFADLGIDDFNVEYDRAMVCGSIALSSHHRF